jgi:pyruvate dehydrogenase E2 component (dihydrolipoamide acetyltransferase)
LVILHSGLIRHSSIRDSDFESNCMAGKVSSNPNEFLLPDLGEGLAEADLVEWCVQPGQHVHDGDVLAKMETAKALVEVYSDRSGLIHQLHGKPGEQIKVGAVLVTYAGQGGPNGASMNSDSSNIAAKSAASTAPAEEAREDAGTVVGSISGEDYSATPGKVRATPAVRALARELDVDLEQVTGTGFGGRIVKSDVEAAANGRKVARKSSAAIKTPSQKPDEPARRESPIPDGQDEVRVPFKGIRREIARRLSESINTAVHFTVMDEADVSELEVLRRRLMSASREKISYLPFVALAVTKALREAQFAPVNSTVDDDKQEIVHHRSVHLGIATDTENGLMVPVIRNCESLGVFQIGRKIAELARGCRERSIPREDLSGSTFTISNFGSLAGRFATPVINYPEAGILAVGRARDGVVARNGMIGVGKLLPLSLSCDHRVVDGGVAATMLARVIELLQSPDELIPAK